MPEAAAAAPAGGEERGGGGGLNIRSALQSVAMFVAIQYVMKQMLGQSKTNLPIVKTDVDTATGSSAPAPINTNARIGLWEDRPSASEYIGQYQSVPSMIAPIWPPNSSLDLQIYVSPSLVVPPLKSYPRGALVLDERKMIFNNWTETRDIETSFDVPKEVQNNATLWAHFFIAQTGAQMDPNSKDYDYGRAFHFVRPITQYFPKKKVKKARNLLSGSKNATTRGEDEEKSSGSIVASYYHPNFTLSLVPDNGVIAYTQTHPAAQEHIELERTGAREATGTNGWYYPIFYLNTFWQLRTHMTELNSTVTRLPINIHIDRQANWKFNILSTMDFSMKQNAAKAARGETMPGGGDGSEFEQIKSILLDSNPYLLATTFFVSILHTIFEFLAFKNDVSHWRKKKDNVGVSVRTILANVFMQTIIFLYLIDNAESTSYMILLPQGLGILLEAWKITKTVDVRLRPTETITPPPRFPFNLSPYQVVFEDKHKPSATELKTQEYDAIAFRYLFWVAIPLLGIYAVYSLYYESHKSWYSFVITTLVGSVYAYGFLMMVPSLYINYRLKSVAHMPAKAMTYKFLNTFIDDLFAFTIKMPTLHRLATLRDDVIFFVYLYQGWKYKVDYARVNEFGQGGDDEEEEEGGKDGKAVEGGKKEELDVKLASQPLRTPADASNRGIEAAAIVGKNGSAKVGASSGRAANGVATKRK